MTNTTKPALSASPVGEPLRRIVLDTLNAVAPAVENLSVHQEQCDRDGVMVKVSRQALDEVLSAVNQVAFQAAITPTPIADSSEAGTGAVATVQGIARELCLSYGRDPDEPTSIMEMCTADNKPVPTWEVYAEQAEWLLERYSIAALPAPVGEPVAWQFMASDDVVLSTTADKRVVKQWEQSGYHVRPLYTYPPAPAVGAEDVARAIEGIILRRLHEKRFEGYTLEMSLEQANAILSLLSGQGGGK